MSILLAILPLALSLVQPPDDVRTGTVLAVTGRNAFARGTRWSFFVGGEYAAWSRIDDHTALVVVPEVPAGEQRVAAAPELTTNVRHAETVGFVTTSDPKTLMVAISTGNLTSRSTETEIESFALVRARTAASKAALTMKEIYSDAANAFVRSELANAALLPQSLEYVLVLGANAAATADRVRLYVPVRFPIPAGYVPELYVGTTDRGANDERIAGIESLHAEWDPKNRFLTSLPNPPLRLRKGEERTIYIALRRTN